MSVITANSALQKEVKNLTKQLNLLYQIGKTINSTLDFEELFHRIYELVGEVISTDSFYIGLYQEETNFLNLLFIIDEGKRYPGISEPLRTGIERQAIFNKDTVLLNKTEMEIDSITRDEVKRFGNKKKISKSIIASPIIVRDQVLGVITTQSYNMNAYTQEDAKLLSIIATQAGVALENSQLYQRIKYERDKLEAILSHLGEGVEIVDIDFNIQFANKWIIHRYGRALKENKCYKTLFGFQKPCKGCPIGEKNFQKEVSLEIPTKEGKIYLLTLTPFSELDGRKKILEIIRDITDRKKYDEELIQREKLQTVIELAGAVGHELNQPLTGITGYCALLKEDLDEDHPIYKDIEEIEKQATRLEKLVRKFQKITHIEKQRYSGQDKILDLHKSIELHEY